MQVLSFGLLGTTESLLRQPGSKRQHRLSRQTAEAQPRNPHLCGTSPIRNISDAISSASSTSSSSCRHRHHHHQRHRGRCCQYHYVHHHRHQHRNRCDCQHLLIILVCCYDHPSSLSSSSSSFSSPSLPVCSYHPTMIVTLITSSDA